MRIFLSYRRLDFGGQGTFVVSRLYSALQRVYGPDSVFMDLDKIPPGIDFADHLRRELRDANAVLVIIGPGWLEQLDARTGDASDFVRLEVAEALRAECLVIPVLMGGTPMPQAARLPADLAGLSNRQAFDVDMHRSFDADVERLLRHLAVAIPSRQPGTGHTGVYGIEFLWCPPGEFLAGFAAPFPPDRVESFKGFWLGKTPVTRHQWEVVMGKPPKPGNVHESRPIFRWGKLPGDTPVDTVTFAQATAFCERLGKTHAPGERAVRYRLPTAHEWEYACRAGTQTAWCFGDEPDLLKDYAWYVRNTECIRPVGRKLPNRWGFHDMHGNVKEWCDLREGKFELPGEWVNVAGGAWYDSAESCRSASINSLPSDWQNGFRVLLEDSGTSRRPE